MELAGIPSSQTDVCPSCDLGGGPVVGQQLADPLGGMGVHPGQDVAQVGAHVDPELSTGLRDAQQHGGFLAAAFVAYE